MKTQFFSGLLVTALLVAAPLAASASDAVDPIAELEPGLSASVEFRVSGEDGPVLGSASGVLPPAGIFEAERATILQQTNTLRAANGLPPLRLNAALNDIAQDWSVQQARVSTMSHRPDFTGMYPAGWSRAAENVAAGFSPGAVLSAWAGSSGHRANLLSTSTDIGIGIAASSSGRLYYTQNFGRYSSPPPTPPGLVSRLSGTDRFATSAQVSLRSFPGGASTVYIASGFDFPDALSAAAVAGAAGGPLLLVARNSVPPAIMRELRRLDPDRIVVAGGRAVVSDSVMATLRTVAIDVDRIFGGNRFETSRNLAHDRYASVGAPVVFLATGAGFADALAAGPAAASIDAPVVLIAGSAETIDSNTLDLLDTLGTQRVVIVGGVGAVSGAIEQSLLAASFLVDRFEGSDRYATAAAIAARYFSNAQRSYLADGGSFPDALSGGAAAGALGAPLFTVRGACVPSAAHVALSNQGPDDLVLLGGLGVLAPTVAGFYRC